MHHSMFTEQNDFTGGTDEPFLIAGDRRRNFLADQWFTHSKFLDGFVEHTGNVRDADEIVCGKRNGSGLEEGMLEVI